MTSGPEKRAVTTLREGEQTTRILDLGNAMHHALYVGAAEQALRNVSERRFELSQQHNALMAQHQKAADPNAKQPPGPLARIAQELACQALRAEMEVVNTYLTDLEEMWPHLQILVVERRVQAERDSRAGINNGWEVYYCDSVALVPIPGRGYIEQAYLEAGQAIEAIRDAVDQVAIPPQ